MGGIRWSVSLNGVRRLFSSRSVAQFVSFSKMKRRRKKDEGVLTMVQQIGCPKDQRMSKIPAQTKAISCIQGVPIQNIE